MGLMVVRYVLIKQLLLENMQFLLTILCDGTLGFVVRIHCMVIDNTQELDPKYEFTVCNSLRSKFHKCSIHIKNMLFRAHCCTLCASQLWCCYIPMKALYVFECLTMIPTVIFMIFFFCYCSVRQYQVEANVDTCDALVRKLLFRFANRCRRSTNAFVHLLLQSCRSRRSKYVARFTDLLAVNGSGEAYCSSRAL